MSTDLTKLIGRIVKAPENFLGEGELEEARKARRGFMGKALAMGAGVASAALAAGARAADGEDAILTLPEHSKTLGQPVAALGYGMPSKWEKNVQRRDSPGLTRVPQSSVSFTGRRAPKYLSVSRTIEIAQTILNADLITSSSAMRCNHR